jgi:DNA-binding CsgD family transcriptional regulator
MWEERAYRVRRNIAALAATGLGVTELHAEAIRLVCREISTELTCWATIDPETLVISTMASGETRIPAEYEPLLAEAEYATAEPHRFAALAARKQSVATLSELPERERRHSIRLNQVWRPLGLDRELRVLFLADAACWGAAGMVRAGRDFTDREMEFLAAVAPAIASATRLAVRSELHGTPLGTGRAIVVTGPQGELRSATPGALEWRNRLDEISPGRFLTMMSVMAAGARTSPTGEFRAKLRDAHGHWAILHASLLIGAEDASTAVVIEPAAGQELVALLLAAYGLTPREQHICAEVIAGRSTAEIADRLFISAHTVQDHLKSVFAKVGVHSRGELAARLRPDSMESDKETIAP